MKTVSSRRRDVTVSVLLTTFLALSLASQQKPARSGDDNKDNPRAREQWFYQQRAYPHERIPPGARGRAIGELNRMLEAEKRAAESAKKLNQAGPNAAISSSSWTSIGPQPTNTVFSYPTSSGRVTALVVDPGNASTVYLGGAQGGVWKTTDGGSTWAVLTDGQPTLAVGSIALDPANSSIVYVGTGEQSFSGDSYYGAGILKSTDGGSTWTNLAAGTFGPPGPSGIGGAHIGAIAVRPGASATLLAATDYTSPSFTQGIFRSTDSGSTWAVVLSGATTGHNAFDNTGTAVFYDPSNGNIAYAALSSSSGGAGAGVYRSTDGGATWAKADTGASKLPTSDVGRISMAIAPSSTNTLFAGIGSDSTGSLLGLYKSTDSGANWTKITNGALPALPDYCTNQCWYDNVIAVLPNNASVVYAGGSAQNGTLFRSTDGGTNWAEISTGANGVSLHVDHHALAFAADSSKLYVGNDGGAWSTTNVSAASVNWTNLNGGLGLTQFYPGLSLHPTDSTIAFGGTQDNGTQKYSSSAWNYATCGDGGWTALDTTTPNTVYATCQFIDIRKSTTGGAFGTWTSGKTSGITGTDRVSFIPPFVIDPTTTTNLYFGTYRVYQTTNGATSWTAISPDLSTGTDNAVVTTIAVAPTDSNTVYAGLNDSRIQVTTNANLGASATWTLKNTGLPNRSVTMVVVDPAVSTTVYATFSGFSGFGDTGHIFKSTNGGTNWADVSGTLPNTPVNDLVVDPDRANTLYAGTDIGVFRSTDSGSTWATLVTGLPKVAVLSLKLHRASCTLRAATHGRGVWDLLLTPCGGVSLAPSPLTFATPQPVLTSSTSQPITLSNTGTSSVTVNSVTPSGDFSQTNNCTTVAASGTCTINVTFTPAQSGTRSGSISVSDTASGSPHSLNLSGTGFYPQLNLSALDVTFGSQATLTTSGAQLLTLSNGGTISFNLSQAMSGDFGKTTTCGSTLAGGATCTISVTFTPTATGLRTGTLSINDGAVNSPTVVRLFGTGTAGATPAAKVSLSNAAWNFGNQTVNVASSGKLITLTNSGGTALSVTGISADGGGQFSQSNTCGSSVNIGSSCTITVTFTPTTAGTKRGYITIVDSASGSPHVIRLTGNGSATVAVVSFSADSLNFGNQTKSTTSSSKTVTVTNSGSASLTISAAASATTEFGVSGCVTTLTAGSSCTLTVTFTPSSTGTRLGSISLTNTATGSPHVIRLFGTGI